MSKHNGGPAFPVDTRCSGNDDQSGDYGHQTGAVTWQFGGMTLRDYFAAKVMATMISMCQHGDGEWDAGTVAQNAYALADAMLVERAGCFGIAEVNANAALISAAPELLSACIEMARYSSGMSFDDPRCDDDIDRDHELACAQLAAAIAKATGVAK